MAKLDSSSNSSKDYSDVEVLLVDDQKASRILLRAFLTRIGIGTVDEAKDGIEGLRVLRGASTNSRQFDIVFISRKMKEMSGLDLLKNVRKVSKKPDLPIVIVSEDAEPSLAKEAVLAGATRYMLRPYTEEYLKDLLKKILRV